LIASCWAAARQDIKIVPILVGAISKQKEQEYGELLAPYLADPSTVFVVSSDFCHWSVLLYSLTLPPVLMLRKPSILRSTYNYRGTRFSYTYYQASAEPEAPFSQLSRSGGTRPSPDFPIHASIEALDRAGMDTIAIDPPSAAHDAFAGYLSRTKNTICGRHPIGVLLGALSSWGETVQLKWTRYERSSLVTSVTDSSVSYASAFVRKV
jgi:AmmeMemoRadiSam system protein B